MHDHAPSANTGSQVSLEPRGRFAKPQALETNDITFNAAITTTSASTMVAMGAPLADGLVVDAMLDGYD
eukprot:751098-Karenia_brevis.AAC.1